MVDIFSKYISIIPLTKQIPDVAKGIENAIQKWAGNLKQFTLIMKGLLFQMKYKNISKIII